MAPSPVQFDVAGARNAGYSDDEILSHLSQSGKFNVDGAVKAGYSPNEILNHVAVQKAVTGVKPPAPPSELAPPTFNERIADRIHQNAYMIPNMLEGGLPEYARGLTTPAGKAQAAQMQQEAGQQGRQIVYGNATSTLGKVANVATIMPRMIVNQAKQYWQDPATAVGDVVTAAPALAEMKLPGNKQFGPPPPPEGVAPALSPEHTAALDAENLRMGSQLAKQQSADALAAQQRDIATRIQQNAQQTHEVVRGALNERWDALRDKVGDAPVETKPIIDAIDQSRKMLAGTPSDLKIFNDIVKNLDQRGAEELGEAVSQGKTSIGDYVQQHGNEVQPPNSLPFGDARTQYSALGEQWSNADGNLRRALKNAYDAYGKQIEATAEAKGVGGEYSDLKRDWSQYVNDWQGKSPLAKVRNAPHPAYVTPVAKGVGSDLLSEQLARYQQAGADPSLVGEMQQSVRGSKAPQLRPVPVPPIPAPEPSLGQRLTSHLPRVIGKVAGGTAGAAIGHPLIGYSIGGEVGADLGKRYMPSSAPPTPPLPRVPISPEDYTRTILAAKDGEISPGEANRRISKAGGSVKVKPLPRPPD